jgi:hypothetical protein
MLKDLIAIALGAILGGLAGFLVIEVLFLAIDSFHFGG